MKLLTALLVTFITFQGFAQDTLITHTLSPQEAQEDLAFYVRLLKETHPGLYLYSSQKKIDGVIDSLMHQFNETVPFYDFYKSMAWLNGNIKCAHSFVLPTENFQSYVQSQIKSIPFYLIPVGDKIHVLYNGTSNEQIKPGHELLSVNGKTTKDITTEIKKYAWTDGNVKAGKNFALQGAIFNFFHYTLFNQPNLLQLTFANEKGERIEIEVPASTYSSSSRYFKKNPVNKEVFKKFGSGKKNSQEWKVEILDDIESTAYIKIPSFGGKKINSEEDGQAFTKEFMDEAMNKINKKKSKNLILDLRYNSGGWDIMGTELMTYLLQDTDTLRYYGPAYAVTNKVEFLKYSDLAGYDKSHLEKELIPQEDGTFLLNEEYNLSRKVIRRKENSFRGKIYLLIDEYTASAASEFAAIAKSNQIATLIGIEVNGTYSGQNSSSFITMPLPNSKVYFRIPLVRSYNEVEPIQPMDRGALPDHTVTYAIKDVLERRKVTLNYIKDLIRGVK